MNGSRYIIDGIYAVNCGGPGGTPGPCDVTLDPVPLGKPVKKAKVSKIDAKVKSALAARPALDKLNKEYMDAVNSGIKKEFGENPYEPRTESTKSINW